ncbi:hypothetical protein [Bowmanella dokdonensis]|uniref:Bacterial OB-fold domain-containing protein n=1 Tax=Bowmanella dokdonensis TaxID=751969 RepID=A0A939DQ70_9ALTE|nr:hypothetical protein [Bowmanella dokdonensis]MBN7826734.1 hypothetical protein [Bowmanella dokdonensis]
MFKLSKILSLALMSVVVAPAMAQDPYQKLDGSWISLNGTVVTAGADSFELDYGKGIVTVEMDDWDWYGDAYPILAGDEVTVNGQVDDDLYETTSVEAGSVYVKDLNTYFYANDVDEESMAVPIVTPVYIDNSMQLRGNITSISGREFTIDTGNRKMQIDTSEMIYNPLDNKGFQKLNKGDYVQVVGELDIDVFENNELMASVVTTLHKDKTKKNGMDAS